MCRPDLVVDCSGRNTRPLGQLVAAGFDDAGVSAVKIDMSYATRILRRRDADIDGAFMIVAASPPYENRFDVLLALEDDRWILTIGGVHGDTCPADDDCYLAFARSLPVPHGADLIERTEALSPVMTCRLASNQRRHMDKGRRPEAFLVLGEAAAASTRSRHRG